MQPTPAPKVSINVPAWAIQVVVGIVVAISAFLVSNEVVNLQGHDTALDARIAVLESRLSAQANEMSTVHIQLDTINQRGTPGADTRISALDSRIAAMEARVTTNADRITRLEQQRTTSLRPAYAAVSGRGGGNDTSAEDYGILFAAHDPISGNGQAARE